MVAANDRSPPSLVDVDGDGVVDVVALFQRRDEVFVAAIDGATAQRKWIAGPFHGGTSHRVIGKNLVVTDGGGNAHVIALADGRETRSKRIGDGAKLCYGSTAHSPNFAAFETSTKNLYELDPETGATSTLLAGTTCFVATRACGDPSDRRGCFFYSAFPDRAPASARAPSHEIIDVGIEYVDGDHRVAVGNIDGKDAWYAIGFSHGDANAWVASLGTDGAPLDHAVLENGRFIRVATEKGFGVEARDESTGALIWKVPLIDRTGRNFATTFDAKGNLVAVTCDNKLVIIDARDGHRVGEIDSVRP